MLTESQRTALELLGRVLVEIRGIAGESAAGRHVSSRRSSPLDSVAALKAIYCLADAAHNLPEFLAHAGSMVPEALERVAEAGVQVYGNRNPFQLSADEGVELPVPNLLEQLRPQ